MDANWYEDPLGRYAGRYFDGQAWTDQVSANGELATDADFVGVVLADSHPADAEDAEVVLADSQVVDAEEVALVDSQVVDAEVAEVGGIAQATAQTVGDEVAAVDALLVERDVADVIPAVPHETDMHVADLIPTAPPAVEPVADSGPTQADPMVESPGRTVAVLSESVFPAGKSASGKGAKPGTQNKRFRLMPLVLGLLTAAAIALLVVLWARSGSDTNDGADATELNEAQEDRVEDLEEGGLDGDENVESLDPDSDDVPEGSGDASSFDPSESIEVGSSNIVNGQSMLADLENWHEDYAAGRGVELGPDASCWFGQLAGAAVQVALCGPVSGTADTEFVFDSVPLVFEDAAGGQIALPLTDEVVPDARVASALTLIGATQSPDREEDSPSDEEEPTDGSVRGDRNLGDGG